MNTIYNRPIGLFDSGYGGLSILREMHHLLPDYDYLYLGDNGRAPYGDRSFQEVYEFTRQAVGRLFSMGCPLVILACNTASAKALRTLQQRDLPVSSDPSRRVLGVIRPTVERVERLTYSGHVGLIATEATVSSRSYEMELAKICSGLTLTSHACPRWVPLIEAGRQQGKTLYQCVTQDLQTLLQADPEIDVILLGCTHYPLITAMIQTVLQHLGHPEIILMPQGKPVAYSLQNYLCRHPEMRARLSTEATTRFYTTGDTVSFDRLGALFVGSDLTVASQRLTWN